VRQVSGVEHEDTQAELMSQVRQAQVIAAGGFHGDAALGWQGAQKGLERSGLVGHDAGGECFLGTGHDDIVLGHIHADA